MSIWRHKLAIGYMLAGSALTLTGAALMNHAQAQGTQPAPEAVQPPAQPGGFGGGGFGGRQGGFGQPPGGFPGGGMRMPMGGGGASITATDKYVYVLRGDTLYQFSTDGLKLMAKADIPRPEPPVRQPRDGNGPPP